MCVKKIKKEEENVLVGLVGKVLHSTSDLTVKGMGMLDI